MKLVETPPRAWGKRLILAACALLPLILGLLLFIQETLDRRQRIGWDNVVLLQAPPMPAADFLREIRAAGGWNASVDFGDLKTLEALAHVCSQHEWVACVNNISLGSPRTVYLDLTFRKPVARLQRAGQSYWVDRSGKWLIPLPNAPSIDLVELIGWDKHWPLDDQAKLWLKVAAQLAEFIQPARSHWGIDSIVLVQKPVLNPELRLQTTNKQQIIWQTLEAESTAEPPPNEKLARLRVYFDRFGGIPSGQMLDVRSPDGILRLNQAQ